MPRAKADPELVAAAFELRAAGCPLREIAETLGVTAPTVKRWLDDPPPAPVAAPSSPAGPLPSHMAPARSEIKPVAVGDDITQVVQAMLERTLQRSADAEAGGNHTAAQREGRDAAALVTVLARVKAEGADDPSVLRISRADVLKIEESLRERVAAICNRPLLCSACSRRLSVQWGTGTFEPATDAEPDSNVIGKVG